MFGVAYRADPVFRYGCIIALSGMVNLFQPAIDAANHEVFHDNPIPINVGLAALGSGIGASLVVYVWVQSRRVLKEHQEEESEWERNMMIREEDESEVSELHL